MRLSQELREQAVAVAIHVVGFWIDARQGRLWRISCSGVVVARPWFLTTRNLEGIADAVSVEIKVTVAVAVVEAVGVKINRVQAQVVVHEFGVRNEVAGVGVETISFANAVEDDVQIVRRHG